ncbi:dTDP-4-amino-4,6-dideoxygalactose transaminase [Methanogenium organophilum]|uniref:dTDP-4-amino-4,6-dideoxygalactose transaminase n=1 Tax=Methanogenium organophilum TaxID=2199 RepID=A0A9X9T892_METOG|nr:dTDP-4-amino-4,6-dideoxygalactose transaminase [Methanogenium organophilum]WAI01211.1 dTDP-4-amino-4,6-dideoxygalactose transaminase [Methanogenium organophilum]
MFDPVREKTRIPRKHPILKGSESSVIEYFIHSDKIPMIPFNCPYLTGNELSYIEDAIQLSQSGGHISGDGKYTKLVQQFFENRFGARKALLTTSGTSALELAFYLLNLKPGDEVILPSYTFPSTANAIILAGGKPVFADISSDTLNIDPEDIRKKITKNTRAICPVHYGGVSCAMDEIMEIADTHGLSVVEDAAQGVNAKYKGKYLGTIGDFGCYSFHETKNYVCGEGGALLINTDEPKINDRAEILREKGTNRSQFFRGEVDKYTWVDIGSSYLPSDILVALLYAQLEHLDDIQEKRLSVWNSYYETLKPFEQRGWIRLPVIPEYAEHNAHLFYILFETEAVRNEMLEKLKRQSIYAVFHYVPLHSAPMGRQYGYAEGDLPITEDISGRLLRLPIFAGIGLNEQKYIDNVLLKLIYSYNVI